MTKACNTKRCSIIKHFNQRDDISYNKHKLKKIIRENYKSIYEKYRYIWRKLQSSDTTLQRSSRSSLGKE